jgi:hypothetical protein
MQQSSRVVTPLAGTASRAQIIGLVVPDYLPRLASMIHSPPHGRESRSACACSAH